VASSLATFATAVSAAAAISTSSATGLSGLARTSFIHGQRPTFDRLTIELRNRVLSVFFRTHGHESKAARLARESVLHQSDFLHSSSL
jgi:hypothetical protein